VDFAQLVLTLHWIGIGIGAIAAFYLGLVLSKLCATGDLTKTIYLNFRQALKACILGAAIVWSSTLVYISYLANVNPVSAIDPGFWARVTVVALITINLYYIRTVVLPMARQRVGVSIFGGLTDVQQNRMITLGAISSISWITILVLGLIGKIGNSLQDFALIYGAIMAVYLLAIGACVLAGRYGGHWIRQRFKQRLRQKQFYYQKLVGSHPSNKYM
jgi:hypothetical protein